MSSTYFAGDQLPWTTTRCHRLLRPISSRLAILRKGLQDGKLQIPEAPHGRAPKAVAVEARINISQGSKDVRPRGFDKAHDPDWISVSKPKRPIRRTYRARPVQALATRKTIPDAGFTGRPGEVCLPTPFISRSLGRLQDSPQMLISPLQIPGRKGRKVLQTKPNEHLQTMKKEMTPDLWKQVDGLYDGFANLLQATKVPAEKNRKGARSLMSICLRQVPTYIELEEYWKQEDNEDDDRDISAEVYSDLETLGTCEGQGWRPLREVVRAHAVTLLREAIEDRLLGRSTIQGLYHLCMAASAWNEAEEFLASYVTTQKALPPPSNLRSNLFDPEISPCLSMVKDFVERAWRHQFLYDQLEYMLSQELLPVEWLATVGMLPIWTRIVRTLSDSDHRTYANAFALFETAVVLGAGLKTPVPIYIKGEPTEEVRKDEHPIKSKSLVAKPEIREAFSNTISSLLTLFSSVALTSQTRSGDIDIRTIRSITWALESVAVTVSTKENITVAIESNNWPPEIAEACFQRALWSIAAPFFIRISGCDLGLELINPSLNGRILLLERLGSFSSASTPEAYSVIESLPQFVCSIAHCTGRAWKDDGFDQLHRLTRCLTSISETASPHSQWFMKRLALDCSLEFAEQSKAVEHFAFAREIERMVQSSGPLRPMRSPANTAASPAKGSGFRWEEGICEWVASTPFAQQKVKRVARKPIRPLALPPTPISSEVEPDTPSPRSPEEMVFKQSPESPNPPESMASAESASSPETSPLKHMILSLARSEYTKPATKRPLESQSDSEAKRQRTSSVESDSSSNSAGSSKSDNETGYSGSQQFKDNRPRSFHRKACPARKRRSLAEITNIFQRLKTGKSAFINPVAVKGMLNYSGRNFAAKSMSSARNLEYDDDKSEENSPLSNNEQSVEPDSFEESIYRDSSSIGIQSQAEDSIEQSFEIYDSDEDELSRTDIQIRKSLREVNRTGNARNLTRIFSSTSRRCGTRVSVLDDSDDELSFG
ncbi:hypothetical protein K432DRAFT_429643 [Lepidopterella palustris CBS 459.81]|uniref:Uncharacterized protein n=1 Tax=Lepidopterella palustris CBS 459.81 TaxID=1314670 RepID=A0A8E2E0M5_9PEZI|nr:hypothetical protein K432DRAFT_429643 [Lepidopterella palustris CBS 459.81]